MALGKTLKSMLLDVVDFVAVVVVVTVHLF